MNRWFRIASRVSRSTPERFQVTTTAATSGRATSCNCDPRAVERQVPATSTVPGSGQPARWTIRTVPPGPSVGGALRGRAYGAVRRRRPPGRPRPPPPAPARPRPDPGPSSRPLEAADHPGGDRDQGELGGQGHQASPGRRSRGSKAGSGAAGRGRARPVRRPAGRGRPGRPPATRSGPCRRWPPPRPAPRRRPATRPPRRPAAASAGTRRARNSGQPSRAMGRRRRAGRGAASTSGTVAQMPAVVTANRTGARPRLRQRRSKAARAAATAAVAATSAGHPSAGRGGAATVNPMTAAAARARGRPRPGDAAAGTA